LGSQTSDRSGFKDYAEFREDAGKKSLADAFDEGGTDDSCDLDQVDINPSEL